MAFGGSIIAGLGQAAGSIAAGSRDAVARGERTRGDLFGTIVDTVFVGLDKSFGPGNGAAYNPLRNAVLSTLVRPDTVAGLGETINVAAEKQQMLDVLAARQKTLDAQLATATAAAQAGDPEAAREVQRLTSEKRGVLAEYFSVRTGGAREYAADARAQFLSRFPDARDIDRFLTGSADPVAEVGAAKSAADRQRLSSDLTAALYVGVAELDALRAEIEELQYYVESGTISNEQRQQLETLRQQLAGRSDAVAVMKRAHQELLSANVTELVDKVQEHAGLEKRVIRVVEAIETVSDSGKPAAERFDWANATPEQKLQHGRAQISEAREELRAGMQEGNWDEIHERRMELERSWDAYDQERQYWRDEEDKIIDELLEERRFEKRREFDGWLDQYTESRRAWQQAQLAEAAARSAG